LAPRSQHAFTLLEILIALAIVAALAAIAWPSYQESVNRSRIGQAISDISNLSILIERYRGNNNYRLPPNLAALNTDIPDDPWGNPYRYLNIEAGPPQGQVRRDRNLNPLNSDYDLYSMGADGQTQTQLTAARARDDIVRAGNGGFIGLASDH
jgi:general secretion pathway protein G